MSISERVRRDAEMTTPLSVEPDWSDWTDEWSSVSDWLLV